MAVPGIQVDKFRYEIGPYVTSERELDSILAIIEDHGADDAARAVVFETLFGVGSNNEDITWAEFVAGIFALRAMQTAWEANKLAIVKLLKN